MAVVPLEAPNLMMVGPTDFKEAMLSSDGLLLKLEMGLGMDEHEEISSPKPDDPVVRGESMTTREEIP